MERKRYQWVEFLKIMKDRLLCLITEAMEQDSEEVLTLSNRLSDQEKLLHKSEHFNNLQNDNIGNLFPTK